jgi:hypothetical protein
MRGAARIGVSFFFQSNNCNFVCRGFGFRVDRTGRDRLDDSISEEVDEIDWIITWERDWYVHV